MNEYISNKIPNRETLLKIEIPNWANNEKKSNTSLSSSVLYKKTTQINKPR